MNKPRFVVYVCAVASLVVPFPAASSAQCATYKVHFTVDKPLSASVAATLPVDDGFVFNASPAGGYKWYVLIKNLRLVSEDGSCGASAARRSRPLVDATRNERTRAAQL
jgi:hypothetical protein